MTDAEDAETEAAIEYAVNVALAEAWLLAAEMVKRWMTNPTWKGTL